MGEGWERVKKGGYHGRTRHVLIEAKWKSGQGKQKAAETAREYSVSPLSHLIQGCRDGFSH